MNAPTLLWQSLVITIVFVNNGHPIVFMALLSSPPPSSQGAFWGLMVGLVVGVTRFIWENVYPRVPCGETWSAPPIIADVHYLHFGCILFAISGIVIIVVSLFTKPIDEKHVSNSSLREDKARSTFLI